MESPFLSVIVPARNAAAHIGRTCEALEASDYPRELWEMIVVDDASEDDTSLVASRGADTVVRLPGPALGPSYARNRGVEAARGDVLLFLDDDVAVHPATLSRIAQALRDDPSVAAVVGAVGTAQRTGFVNAYRDLVRLHLHRTRQCDLEVFWSGCTAIRRDAFTAVGMFDEWRFRRRQIEDFELKQRLRDAGHGVVRREDVVATHVRRWSVSELLSRSFLDAGMPLARHLGVRRTLLARGLRAPLLPLAGLAWCALLLTLALVGLAVRPGPEWGIAAGVAALAALVLEAPLLRTFVRDRGVVFGLAAALLHLVTLSVGLVGMAAGWLLRHTIGDARPHATIEAFAEVGVKTWPPVPTRR